MLLVLDLAYLQRDMALLTAEIKRVQYELGWNKNEVSASDSSGWWLTMKENTVLVSGERGAESPAADRAGGGMEWWVLVVVV